MTAVQVKNMQNPLSNLNNYTSVYVVDNIEIENIMLPANPMKQKRYIAWNKTVDEIKNDIEFYYLYGKIEIENKIEEVAEWTLGDIKSYIYLFVDVWFYGRRSWSKRFYNMKSTEAILFKICERFLLNYYPQIKNVLWI